MAALWLGACGGSEPGFDAMVVDAAASDGAVTGATEPDAGVAPDRCIEGTTPTLSSPSLETEKRGSRPRA